MLCNKCKRTPCEEGDTWCLGCSGWEALGQELSAHWGSPTLRVLASDVVVNSVRTVRALRQFSSGLASASSAGATRALEVATAKSGSNPKPPLQRSQGAPNVEVKAEPADEEEYESYTEEETAPKAAGARRPAEPDHPPPKAPRGQQEEEDRDHRPRESGSRREEPEQERRGHKRKRRGGRKHQRLHRVLGDPNVRLHRSKPGSYWDSTPSRQGRGALDRRR